MGIFGSKRNEAKSTKPDSNEITTLLGEECEFLGDIKTTCSIRIDGSVKGKVNGDRTIIIGERGFVSGEIKAAKAIVFGKFEGIIESARLEIKKGASVNGEIHVESLIIEDGGTCNGKCTMESVPEKIIVHTHSDTEEKQINPMQSAFMPPQ